MLTGLKNATLPPGEVRGHRGVRAQDWEFKFWP